jgi:hypothetical protein
MIYMWFTGIKYYKLAVEKIVTLFYEHYDRMETKLYQLFHCQNFRI